MAQQTKITVVGSFNMDLSVRTPRMPAPGETILGGPFTSGPGGKGANQAVAAARLGADVTMVVRLGKDFYGDQAAENLAREGVHGEYVYRSEDNHTGVAFIIVDDNGENMIVVAAGTNNALTPADVDRARPAVTGVDMLLLQLEVPMKTVEHAAAMAHAAGVKVVLNPAPGRKLSPELLRNVDVLTPNETETQLITGMPTGTPEEVERAARRLLEQGVGAVVVTLGAKGALVVTQETVERVPGRRVKVVDSTGAGDAFCGALAVSLGEGKPLVDAVRFAAAAAAIQVTRPGTAPAMPTRDEVEVFLAQA